MYEQINQDAASYMITFKPERTGERRKGMVVSHDVAQRILKMRTEPKIKDVVFYDRDGNFDEAIEKSKIESVKRLGVFESEQQKTKARMVICEYGGRHNLEQFVDNKNGCECVKDFYNLPAIEVERVMREDLKFKLFYPSDITETMRDAARKHIFEFVTGAK